MAPRYAPALFAWAVAAAATAALAAVQPSPEAAAAAERVRSHELVATQVGAHAEPDTAARISAPGRLRLHDTETVLTRLHVSTSPPHPPDTPVTIAMTYDPDGRQFELDDPDGTWETTLAGAALVRLPLTVADGRPACDHRGGELHLTATVHTDEPHTSDATVQLWGPDCATVPPEPPITMYAERLDGLDNWRANAEADIERQLAEATSGQSVTRRP